MAISNNPCVPLGLSPSFGFGDRLGLATPGHVAALKRVGGVIQPIFAQQSIREMTRTGRTPQQVMGDALSGASEAGYTGKQGADADHLKTPADVESTAAAGFCFFTIDPSDHVDGQADSYNAAVLQTKFSEVAAEIEWVERYSDKTFDLPGGRTLSISRADAQRAAVKYGRAINHAVSLAGHIKSVMNKLGPPYEIELSVDETPQPTTLAEHYIIADQCHRRGVILISLAPRYVGEFEKGIDFKGDIGAFQQSLEGHAAIAAALGPYKLSLHSGSDKLSIYPVFASATKGRFHVKTAGTSYLEALRVVARHAPEVFRQVIDFARGRYDTDKATYHVSATVAGTPAPRDIADNHRLEQIYLECWEDVPAGKGFTEPGRQILHCTFGSVLQDPRLGSQVRQIVREHRSTYDQVLEEHFARHLEALA
jgi:hypothetical protein